MDKVPVNLKRFNPTRVVGGGEPSTALPDSYEGVASATT